MSIIGGLKVDRGPAALRQATANLAGWARFLGRTPRGGAGESLRPQLGRSILASIVTLAILAASVAIIDAWAIAEARMLPAPVRSAFEEITGFGKSGWFLWPIGIVLLALGLTTSAKAGRIATLVVAAIAVRLTFVFVAIAIPGLLVSIVKRLIGRARPYTDGAPYLFDPFAWSAAYASMPSGHATTACAAAIAIGGLWPRTRFLLWGYALLIAVSRVAVTAHHPSDVVAGAVVGVAGAVLVRNWFATRRLGFAVGEGGHVHCLPGPSWLRIKTVARQLCGA